MKLVIVILMCCILLIVGGVLHLKFIRIHWKSKKYN